MGGSVLTKSFSQGPLPQTFSKADDKALLLQKNEGNENTFFSTLRIGELFLQIRDELDEHREAINENTIELQSNYEFLCELDRKIMRLAARVDELAAELKAFQARKSPAAEASNFTQQKPVQKFVIQPLTKKEKSVFLALYSLCQEKCGTTYAEIAANVGVSEQLIASYITALIAKGIPVLKRNHNGTIRLNLDQEFVQLQAKENIVGLDTPLSYWFDC
ncbi:MAG: winged helix-turn-helix domain-containing protein [Candidatus Woesearchaeota archaeon]